MILRFWHTPKAWINWISHWRHAALSGPTPTHKSNQYFLSFCLFYTLLSLSGNLGRLTWVRLQQPQEQRNPVLQVHAGTVRVSVIDRTLTWTTWYLTYVLDHSYACVRVRLGTPRKSQHNSFDSDGAGRDSNRRSLDLESDALPTEPARHPIRMTCVCHCSEPSCSPLSTASISGSQMVQDIHVKKIMFVHAVRVYEWNCVSS